MNVIAVSPVNGSFGFNINFDSKKIHIPGYTYDTHDFMKDDDDEKSEMRFILEEDFGCSYYQVNLIKYLIQLNKSGYIEDDLS